jgi:hypothetical protein
MAKKVKGMVTEIESGGLEASVVLYGYNDFKKKLKEADAELRKAMDKEIRDFITPVSSLAKAYVPSVAMRNWKSGGDGVWSDRLGWDQSAVIKGIAVRQGGKRSRGSATSAGWRIQNKSAAGAVYELAGKKSSGSGTAGMSFINAITLRGGRPSRLIWRAWDAKGGEQAITRSVVETIHKFENELQRKLDQ